MDTKNLPQLMRDAMLILKELHNTPPEMAVLGVLGVANLAAQAHYDVDSIHYGIRPISLFLLGMAPTGATKSTVFSDLMKGIRDYEEEQRVLLNNDQARFDLEDEIYRKQKAKAINEEMRKTPRDRLKEDYPQPEEAKEKLKALFEGRGFKPIAPKPVAPTLGPNVAAITLPTPPVPVRTADYTISKATLNGIIDNLKKQHMIGLFSSEAGEFFNSHSFQGANGDNSKAIEMSAGLTSMWDGSRIEKTTQIESVRLYNRRVNMLFLLQEATIRRFMSNPMYSEQGFVHRILLTHCDYFELPKKDSSAANIKRLQRLRDQLSGFHDRIKQIISKPPRIKEGQHFEVEPEIMVMTEESACLLDDWANGATERADSDMKEWAGFMARIHEHAIRIAATLAAFDLSNRIQKQHMLGTIDLMNFFIAQRKSLRFEMASSNAMQVSTAQRLVEWIREKDFDDTLRVFRQHAPCGYGSLSNPEREKLLAEMVSTGDVETYEAKAANGREVTKIRAMRADSVESA